MNIATIVFRAISALKHSLSAKGADSIHSPFLFELYNNVLTKNEPSNDYYIAQAYREDLMESDMIFKDNNNEETELWGEIETSAISEKTGSLLFRLVKHFKPKTLLELGTNAGVSTMFLAVALKGNEEGVKFYTIEKNPDLWQVVFDNYSHKKNLILGMPEIKFIKGDFKDRLPEVLNEIDTLDFVFIDGDHTKIGMLNYFNQCAAKASEKSVFVFDDIHWSAEMYDSWQQITQDKRISLSLDLLQLGIVFFDKKLSKQEFKIKWE
ncbi:MAG: class I SAM-dependent methyltransferase [Bacteroidetes bacterium]|nr:class I SAM-dependent methyltransferase [Bacteroidota bacterium]